MIGIVMFFVALFALLLGFPVAFTFGGIALIFGVWAEGIEMFASCHIAFNPSWKTRY